jgi:hypothetical protein
MISIGSTATRGIAPALRGGATSMTLVLASALCAPMHAAAQVTVGGSAEASGDADIESGANSASDIERGGTARGNVDDDNDGRIDEGEDVDVDVDENDGVGGEGLRLAIQGRIDAINMVAIADPDPFLSQRRLLVPIVTPGVRLLDDNELFLGLGLGFSGYSSDNGPNEQSRSGWSLSPLASYDVLKDDVAALALLGWINLASLGEEENCDAGGCETENDDGFGWGLSLGAGLRGFVSEGLALGGEFGGPDVFVHGIFGNIFLEASIGLD